MVSLRALRKIKQNEREIIKMYTITQKLEQLKIETLKGVESYLVTFEDIPKVLNALEVLERYEDEQNIFIKESMLKAYESAGEFIQEWKNIHNKKVKIILDKKEAEHKKKLENTKKAKAKAPELEKAYNNLKRIIAEMLELDKDVFISPYNSIYGNKKASSSEIISDFEAMIHKTMESCK